MANDRPAAPPMVDERGLLLPEPADRRVYAWQQDPSSHTALVAVGRSTTDITVAGTARSAVSANAPFLLYATANILGAFASIQQTGGRLPTLEHGIACSHTIEMGADVTSIRRFIGLRNSTTANAATADDVASWSPNCAFIGFRYSTAASDPAWMAVVADGGGLQHTYSTGVPVVDGTRYSFLIDCRDVDSYRADLYIGVGRAGLPTFAYSLVQTFDLRTAFTSFGTIDAVGPLAWMDNQQNLAASARDIRWAKTTLSHW